MRQTLAVLGVLLSAAQPGGALLADSPAGIDFFERKIRPVLIEHCYKCHSRSAKKIKGGLRLDSRDALRKGGESGPALVPGNEKDSLLLKALRHEEPRMPPAGKLPEAVIADFARWIRMGAPDPRSEAVAAAKTGTLSRDWWSLQPVRRTAVPPVKDTAWARTPIDRFILARLEQQGLTPAKDAERRVVLRRLTFALTGLPPTPEEVATFEADSSPDAVGKLVDRLLASPHFGERWARHWMDLVCYSESHGIEHDPLLPHAWRYRDYLIRAFNDDVPYDRFVKEHVAGDLLAPRWNRSLGINEAPIGTTFFRFVELYPTPVDVKNEEMNVLEIEIDTFGKTFQGLTLACARCHDHKFDPISARDYHALYGIFASARLTMRHLDDPARLHAHDAELGQLKKELRRQLASLWQTQLGDWPGLIPQAIARGIETRKPVSKAKEDKTATPEPKTELERWSLALQKAADQPAHPLYPLAILARDKATSAPGLADRWRQLAAADKKHRDYQQSLRKSHVVFADFTNGATDWHVQGQSLAQSCPPGDFAVNAIGPDILTGIYPRGRYSHLLSDKHGGALRSPNFILSKRYVSALVCGTNGARLRLVIENFPGDELLFESVMPRLKNAELRWVTLPVRDRWDGRRAYLEVIPRDEMTYAGRVMDASKVGSDGRSGVGIRQVVLHDSQAPELVSPLSGDFWDVEPTLPVIAARFSDLVGKAIVAWASETCTDEQAVLLDGLVRAGVLTNRTPSDGPVNKSLAEFRTVEARVNVPQRIPAMVEDEGFDVPYFPRGNYLFAKDIVPRRYLEVLDSKPYSLTSRQSGRRQLAEEIASPHNPLTARVMVNRLWQHLFGAGLVRSVDNFGKLGELPSHPELLDWLATEFMEHGWSIKHMLRLMATSRVLQLASEPSNTAREMDPDNRLLSHASLRRLDAESIRDALLHVSGRLDRTPYGLGVPLPAAPFKDFYLPISGPLDGKGRRSVYLEVRRNFLSPFSLTFDQPRPISSTGQRSLTNVPAQALALQNDPFVAEQAKLFARRVLETAGLSPEERVTAMYRLALGRAPTAEENSRALEFLREQSVTRGEPGQWQSDLRGWEDLAHAVFNFKEFIYFR